jgi:hypothetical protein
MAYRRPYISILGRSHLGEGKTPTRVLANNARHKQKLIDNGLCITCGKRPHAVDRSKQHCAECLDKRKEHNKKTYKENPAMRARRLQSTKDTQRELRTRVIQHYGGKCACCGEDEFIFLDFDHMNGGGSLHRKELKLSGNTFVRWLIDNDYPSYIRLLCANCNQGRYRNKGMCPHMKEAA